MAVKLTPDSGRVRNDYNLTDELGRNGAPVPRLYDLPRLCLSSVGVFLERSMTARDYRRFTSALKCDARWGHFKRSCGACGSFLVIYSELFDGPLESLPVDVQLGLFKRTLACLEDAALALPAAIVLHNDLALRNILYRHDAGADNYELVVIDFELATTVAKTEANEMQLYNYVLDFMLAKYPTYRADSSEVDVSQPVVLREPFVEVF